MTFLETICVGRVRLGTQSVPTIMLLRLCPSSYSVPCTLFLQDLKEENVWAGLNCTHINFSHFPPPKIHVVILISIELIVRVRGSVREYGGCYSGSPALKGEQVRVQLQCLEME